MTEQYKFQKLDVYKLALSYLDDVYAMTATFPSSEKFHLKQQRERAATSVVLNIAEGSTGQSDAEQHRLLVFALRSYPETVQTENAESLTNRGHELSVKLQAFRRSLKSPSQVSGPPSTKGFSNA